MYATSSSDLSTSQMLSGGGLHSLSRVMGCFWKLAMEEEIASLIANFTWSVDNLPDGVRPIPCKWVFKIKDKQRV
jgi:hypothetical protein